MGGMSMAGMGETSLKKPEILETPEKTIGKFFSTTSSKQDKERYTIQKGFKISQKQNQNLEKLKIALGTDLDSEALRWCFDQIWQLKGEEIEEVARKKKEISLS
jgi:UDP-galactopyranose mutase